MKQARISLILLIFLSLQSCQLMDIFKDDCEDTEAPEINFWMRAGGTVKFMSYEATDITSQFEGKTLTITFYKDHCSGTISGPFDQTYTIDKYGVLWRNGIGYWSFKMNNTKDRMRTRIYYDGKSLSMPIYDEYDAMKQYDGSGVYHEYMITIDLNEDNATVMDALVKRVN
jgi:hypothetical protein